MERGASAFFNRLATSLLVAKKEAQDMANDLTQIVEGFNHIITSTFEGTPNLMSPEKKAFIKMERPVLVSTLRASLREASLVTTALAVTLCSIVPLGREV